MRAKNLEQEQVVLLVWPVLQAVLLVSDLLVRHHQSGVPLPKNTSGVPAPLKKWSILSSNTGVPVKRTTDTTVSPPLVPTFKVRGPPLRNCDCGLQMGNVVVDLVPLVRLVSLVAVFFAHPVRLKVAWPLPCGPPEALYTGRMADPTGAFPRVDTDANEGGPNGQFVQFGPIVQLVPFVPFVQLPMARPGTRAKNLEQVVHVVLLVKFMLQEDVLVLFEIPVSDLGVRHHHML
jgi:hypothetical protein